MDIKRLMEAMPKLNGTSVKLYVGLSSEAGTDNVACLSYRGLMRKTGMSRDSVARAIRALETKGLIKVQRIPQEENLYTIT